jgi:hypothetical protein
MPRAYGDEPGKYKAFSGLFDQLRRDRDKTIANCRESAHAVGMSQQPIVSARPEVGPLR